MRAVVRRNKTCEINIFLFGKPAWELDLEGADASKEMAATLRDLGNELKERLLLDSYVVTTLIENGWTGSGGLYDISFYKDVNVEQAEEELKRLGIDPRWVSIHEDEWEDEDEGEDIPN